MGISFVFTLLFSVLVGPAVFAGVSYHSLIIKSDGSLHTFGYNTYGQLGDGTTTLRNTPTQILASGVSQIAAGGQHSLILKADGSLHTFGRNLYGQLGDGTTTQRNTPTQILASGVSQIAAGFYHSLILKADGSLHTFGYNTYGQLGDGTTTNRNTPTQILASGVSQIAAGFYHSLILKADGSLHTFGYNAQGQLGDGTTTQRNTPTQILASGVSQIAAGGQHSLILKADGSLHTFGYNTYGQLGDGTTTNRNTPTQILASGVSQIAAGFYHSLILKADGSLHTFGRNNNGQLGDGTTTNRNTPTQILASGVSQIAAGYYHSLILKADGSLHTFGSNGQGQLGDGTTSNRTTPTQILASGVARLSEQLVPFAETFTVSGGQFGAPYYTFTDSLGNNPDMTSFTFHKGSRYLFTSNNISGSHPFMIGTSHGVSSPIVNGGPLNSAGNGDQIIVDIPHDFNSTLVYYCTAHGNMLQTMNIAAPPSEGFIPIYPLNASQLTTLVNSSNIVAGNFKIVEEMNASNEFELRIRPVFLSNGNWVDWGSNTFYSTNSSYPTLSSVLQYINSNNINAVNAPAGNTLSITSPTSGTTVEDSNDNLHVYISYQSSGGGYQTPTWAYRIGSGFPSYGSPHGGIQVVGSTYRSNFLAGQAYGSKTVHVALLDQSGNLHNPPVTQSRSFTYQSSSGGYQTPGSGYQTPSSGYQTPASGYQSPGSGYQTPGGGYQTPSSGYQSPGSGYQTPSSGYQTPSSGYQSPGSGYQTPSGGYQSPSSGYQSPGGGYQSPSGGNQSPGSGYQTPGSGYQTPSSGYQSPGSGYQSPGSGYQSPGGGYQSPGSGYQSPSSGYQTTGGGYQSPTGNSIAITYGFRSDDYGSLIVHDGTVPSSERLDNLYKYYEVEKEVYFDKGKFSLEVNGGGTGERYMLKQGDHIIFDTAGGSSGDNKWATEGSAWKYDFDKFEIEYSPGEPTTFKFVPQSAGNNSEVKVPAEAAPDNSFDNKAKYLPQLGLGSSDGDKTSPWNAGDDYSNTIFSGEVGEVKTFPAIAGETKLTLRVEASSTFQVKAEYTNLINPESSYQVQVGGGYQTPGSGYQTPGIGYQSPGGGYQTPGGGYQTPGSGYQTSGSGYQSPSSGYQTPTGGWTINPAVYPNNMSMTVLVSIDGAIKASGSLAAFSGAEIRGLQSTLTFPSFGPHNGQGLFQIMVYGDNHSTPLQFKWSPDGTEANSISLSKVGGGNISFINNDNLGNLISPVSMTGSSSPGSGYQTPGSGYQTPGGGYQSPSSGYQTPGSGYQSPGGGYQTPSSGYQSPSSGYQTPGSGYQTPGSGYQTSGSGYQSPSSGYQSPGSGYQSPGSGYQTPGSGYQSPGGGYQTPGSGSQSPSSGYQTPTGGWTINPAVYPNNMSMTVLVSIDGGIKASGSLAAFSGAEIRGLQSTLTFPSFGPHNGQGLFQIMVYGDSHSIPLQFKWSPDGTEANSISLSKVGGGDISFINNDNLGNLISPVSMTGSSSPGTGYQTPGTGYQTPGSGYQSPGGGYQSPSSGYQTPTGGWTINPAVYPNNMSMTVLVSIDGAIKASGSLAAFSGAEIRGLQSTLTFPSFGPYNGQGLFQIMVYGDSHSIPLQFKWSPDGTEANSFSLSKVGGGNILFINNDNLGNLISPVSMTGFSSPGTGYQTPGSGYQTPGGGYQTPGSWYQSPGSGSQTPGGGYQTPGGGYQSGGGNYQSPSGNSNQPATPVVLKPSVETLSFSLNQKQITLNGKSSQSGSQNTFVTVGFLLSSYLKLDPLDPTTVKITSILQADGKFSSNYSLPEGDTFYFKAFAENVAGIMYGKTLRIVFESETDPNKMNPSELALYILKSDSVKMADGWVQNVWFGRFREFDQGWIYHLDHGWMFLSSDYGEGIWAWSPFRGWCWSTKEIYPFFYQNNLGDWIYYVTKINGNAYYYNYSTSSLESNTP